MFYALGNKYEKVRHYVLSCGKKEGEGDKSMCKFPNINYEFIFFFAVFEPAQEVPPTSMLIKELS